MIEIRHLDPAAFGDPLLEVRIARAAPVYPASLKWLLAGFGLLCLGVASAFAFIGAYPVFGFAGFEIVLLFALLRVSFRRRARDEAVRLAGDTTVISRGGPNGLEEAARLQSYWLRIEDDAYGSARGLWLRSRDQRVAVGAGLHAHELGQLAAALRQALFRLKSLSPIA